MVSLPGNPEKAVPVAEVEGTRIDSAFIGSCTDGRYEDMKMAADILNGREVAPGIVLVTALVAFSVVPFGYVLPVGGKPVEMIIAPAVDIGLVYILALSALATYGALLGGWASNNKYSFLGGLRTTAQLLSYEVPLALAVLGVVLVTGSLRLEDIVARQAAEGWNVLVQPLGLAQCHLDQGLKTLRQVPPCLVTVVRLLAAAVQVARCLHLAVCRRQPTLNGSFGSLAGRQMICHQTTQPLTTAAHQFRIVSQMNQVKRVRGVHPNHNAIKRGFRS